MSKSYVGLMGCPRCGKPSGVMLDRRMKDTFEDGKVYTGDLCVECETEIKQFEKEVERGGVYFHCTMCNRSGVIVYSESTREMLETVREKIFTRADEKWMSKPCGIEFDECEQHGGENSGKLNK